MEQKLDTTSPSVVARLIATMDASPGFAGLGNSINTISSLSDDGDGGREITTAILRDAALTAKLLRLANSSYHSRGGRNVSTVDQAIVLLGLKTVKAVALSLALVDSLSSRPQSNLLQAEIVASYFCGALAAEITRLNAPRFNPQEAQVCGLLQNLGRMMVLYYQYEEVEKSRALQLEENIGEDEAILRTLGMSYGDVTAAIARHWDLPYIIQQSLGAVAGKTPPRAVPANAVGWHQVCSAFAQRVTDLLFRLPENREKMEQAAAIEFYRLALQLREDEARESIDRCLEETGTMLSAIAFPCTLDGARNLLRKTSERALDILSAQDRLAKENDRAQGKTPIETIHYALRLLHDHYGFDRTLLCLPDGSSGLVAIAGVGRNIGQVTSRFRCQGAKPDIFRVAMGKEMDVFLADVTNPTYARLIPDWYRELIGARSLLLLSLVHEKRFLGLVYGDYQDPPSAPPQGYAEGVVKTWRDQIVASLLAGSPKSA